MFVNFLFNILYIYCFTSLKLSFNRIDNNQRPHIIIKQEEWKEGVYILSFKLIYTDDMHSS